MVVKPPVDTRDKTKKKIMFPVFEQKFRQVLDQLEVSTVRNPTSDNEKDDDEMMTISLAKEKLKARRLKGASRKKSTTISLLGPAGSIKEDETDDLLVSGEFLFISIPWLFSLQRHQLFSKSWTSPRALIVAKLNKTFFFSFCFIESIFSR